jgi:cell division protein FtsI (penicillin-binding protein 3)
MFLRAVCAWLVPRSWQGGDTMNAIKEPATNTRLRLYLVLMVLALGATALVVRAVDLQVLRKEFYQDQGDQRFLRDKTIAVSRGMILDRNGEPLAVSTPVVSVWAEPAALLTVRERLPELARALGLGPAALSAHLEARAQRNFVYLRRQLAPEAAAAALALELPGVHSQREFKRYYPSGEVTAHVLGFTDVDDRGQEGIELAFDDWLSGTPGVKRVIQDRRGDVVENVELLREPQQGRDLTLTIDRRLQYLAYRELKAAANEFGAASGTVVILEIASGEILAMVNWPSFNPNARAGTRADARRNRAVTDVLEPGSVIKPFTVAAGLESGRFDPQSRFDTAPMLVANHIVRDIHDFGVVDTTRLLTKSSNVAAARIALALSNDHLYDVFHRFGFGSSTGCGFPGESSGVLPAARGWGMLEKATLGYGYGLSVTPLQLATAYAALGDGGRLRAPTFVRGSSASDAAVLDPDLAATLLGMLETVVGPEGTGAKAVVPNYRVAGKTGTTRKAVPGGYQRRYVGVFAGVVPASAPRLAAVVVINDPGGEAYYGGLIAAPVFARVMQGALRLLDIAPDRIEVLEAGLAPSAAAGIAIAPTTDSPYAEGVAP